MNMQQFKNHAVEPVLEVLKPSIPRRTGDGALVLGTMAWESQNFEYLVQLNGPALGFGQMEPATYDDIWGNFLATRRSLYVNMLVAAGVSVLPPASALVTNIALSVAMVRVQYFRASEPLPLSVTAETLAAYYKAHYNTALGAADITRVTPIFKAALSEYSL